MRTRKRTKSAVPTSHLLLKKKLQNSVRPQCRDILHLVCRLWRCSLEGTLPPRFRLDLCLGRNVPSQPGMTTTW